MARFTTSSMQTMGFANVRMGKQRAAFFLTVSTLTTLADIRRMLSQFGGKQALSAVRARICL